MIALLLSLSGCASTETGNPTGAPPQSTGAQENNPTASQTGSTPGTKDSGNKTSGNKPSGTSTPSASFTPYKAPEYAGSYFHEDLAEGDDVVQLDLSATNLGYVAVSVKSDTRVKMTAVKDDIEYQYNVPSDGTPAVFPLQCGDGNYVFKVWRYVPETGKYLAMYKAEKDVKLDDEYQPFLRPSEYVNYDKNSKCVKKAAELAKQAEDALGVVAAVYEYICENIEYDQEKAVMIQMNKTYLPDPDEIMELGQGICLDYAALAASMLRSQGIPTKMVYGNVSSSSSPTGYVYHAWNMFYTKDTGWVTVGYSVKAGDWNRLDLTFSAGGASSEFIGDGGNYTDMKYY